MLEWIRGPLARKDAGRVVIEVGGVGVRVEVPEPTVARLGEPGAQVTLLLTLAVFETDPRLRLYGFATEAERALFEALRGVSGIGAQLALRLLSAMPAPDLAAALARADTARLASVKGLGEKRAEQIVAKLRHKVPTDPLLGPLAAQASGGPTAAGAAVGSAGAALARRRGRGRAARAAEATAEVARSGLGRPAEDTVRALVRLEVDPDDAVILVERALAALGPEATTEQLLRESLRSR